jgi:hypothetical protein
MHAMEDVSIPIEDIRPSSPRIIVQNLSWQIFNRESDVQFEKLFLEILRNKKDPKLFPELVKMRLHIEQELQYRCKADE